MDRPWLGPRKSLVDRLGRALKMRSCSGLHTSVGQIFGYSNIFEYINTNIFIHPNIHKLYPRRIYLDIHLWSIYDDEYILIFIRPISMIANVFEFSLFPKNGLNCYYWSKMVQYGSKITQNMKIAKIVKNNVGQIIWYSNTFKYFGRIYYSQKHLFIFLGQIYSDIHSWYFYHVEYTWIFIRQIYMVTNIFGYSFVQQFDIRPSLLHTWIIHAWQVFD